MDPNLDDDQEGQEALEAAAGALAATRDAVDAFKLKNTEGNTIEENDDDD